MTRKGSHNIMAKGLRTRRTVRHSRALGIALTPKAEKYMERRPYGPGQHGRARRRADSDYSVRLKEKQRLRAIYNIREAQMLRYFKEARRRSGLAGENLVEMLESRLDALVLRAGFARTIAQARQLVVHSTSWSMVSVLTVLLSRSKLASWFTLQNVANPWCHSRSLQPVHTRKSCQMCQATWK